MSPDYLSKSSPKISIIVPVYNVEQYLKRCIDSLINQSHTHLEIILVNDGSIDSSGEICDHYANLDSRIVIVHQDNKGLSGARNSGLNIATGDYIGFVDSDDWVDLEMYKTLLDALIHHKTDLVECNIIGTRDVNIQNETTGTLLKENRLQALKRIIKHQNFSVCRRLYSKHLLKGLQFIEGKNSEDLYFTYDVFKKIKSTVYLPNKFYYYYLGNDSITRGNYSLKALDTVDAALYLKKRVYQEEDSNELKTLTRTLLLSVLFYNYKMLNYNSFLDESKNYRKNIKQLIIKNYKMSSASLNLTLARFAPISVFNKIIRFNSSRKQINS